MLCKSTSHSPSFFAAVNSDLSHDWLMGSGWLARLILDEGHERGDADGDAAAEDCWQLVHQALPCSIRRLRDLGTALCKGIC